MGCPWSVSGDSSSEEEGHLVPSFSSRSVTSRHIVDTGALGINFGIFQVCFRRGLCDISLVNERISNHNESTRFCGSRWEQI